jgi:hypothetical protein
VPSTVLDAPRVTVPPPVHPAAPAPVAGGRPAAVPTGPRTAPLPVVAVAVVTVLESLGLLAVGLSSLDGVFGTVGRPSGGLVALTLVLLAGWVVLSAGGGAGLVDGAGRTLVVSVACGEISLLGVLALAAVLGADGGWTVAVGPLGELPAPALVLPLAVPLGKLFLAGVPASRAWVAAGPKPRVRRPAAAPGRPVLRGVTLALIGLALTTVALLGSPADPATAPATVGVDSAP